MSAMVQIFSWGERWIFYSPRRSRVKWNISSFTLWNYLFYCTNKKHSLFVSYNLYKDSFFSTNLKQKHIERQHYWSKISTPRTRAGLYLIRRLRADPGVARSKCSTNNNSPTLQLGGVLFHKNACMIFTPSSKYGGTQNIKQSIFKKLKFHQ